MFNESIDSISGQIEALDRIPVCESSLTPDSNIEYLTHDAFEQKFKCKYTENLLIPGYSSSSYSFPIQSNCSDIKEEQIIERMQNPLTCLVVCQLDHPIGFSLMNSEIIPKNTVIGFYHGLLETNDNLKNGDFRPYGISFLTDLIIDSQSYGGILRFMAHLPYHRKKELVLFKAALVASYKEKTGIDLNTPEGQTILRQSNLNLDDYVSSRFTSEDDMPYINFENEPENLATANVAMIGYQVNNQYLNVVYATREIPPYSVIGFSYQKHYFSHEGICSPHLLYTDGTLVDTELYEYSYQENPMSLYNCAVNNYNSYQYSDALKNLELALSFFSNNAEQNRSKIASCYSTMASCYRELKCLEDAMDYCIKACVLYQELDDFKKLEFNQNKFIMCIGKYANPQNLYPKAVAYFKNGFYEYSKLVLEHIQNDFQGSKLATVLSTMASCCRELEQIEEAKSLCEEAWVLAKEHSGPESKLTVSIEKKLENIEQKISNQLCLNTVNQ